VNLFKQMWSDMGIIAWLGISNHALSFSYFSFVGFMVVSVARISTDCGTMGA